MKNILVAITGLISLMYLLNIGVGYIEMIPDNIPLVGNLDEAAATVLLLGCLRYFGADLFNILRKNNGG